MTSLDLITPCRNRAEQLLRSLPSWLACPRVDRILIVDFSASPPLLPQLAGFDLTRVTVIRVEDEPIWRLGRAQNVALRYSRSDLILNINADIEVVTIDPYLEAMETNPHLYYRGFSKRGTSSGSCLFRRRQGQRCGGWHDHMSGWGGDDLDFYDRMRRRGQRAALFDAASFQEIRQRMETKNSDEAPRLDSQLLQNQPDLVCQPRFTGVRNTLLSVLRRQNRQRTLRYRFLDDPGNPRLVQARLRRRSRLELAIGQHSVELANILTIHHYRPDLHPSEIMATPTYAEIVERHGLPPARNRQQRRQLLAELPERLNQLRGLADQLGVATLPH